MPPLNRTSIDNNSNQPHNHKTLKDNNTFTTDRKRTAPIRDDEGGDEEADDARKVASSVIVSSLLPNQRRSQVLGQLQKEKRMDENFNSLNGPQHVSLDDEESIGGNYPCDNVTSSSFRSNNNNIRLGPSTLTRPTSSTSLNGFHGSNNNNNKERKSGFWTWISSNVWKNDTCHLDPTENLHQRPRQRKFCLYRWNETTASGWHMTKVWILGMLTPIGIVTWVLTHQLTTVLASILVLPSIAILQGSLAILKYRIQFGDSPLPKAPSHGIVKCISKGISPTNSRGTYRAASCIQDSSGVISEHTNTLYGESSTTFQGFVDAEHCHHPTCATPLRLLVIGDSLAIGVGQSATATPIMPESIAKSLSKAMNGRPVLWTCHGAPGASAGWIVRELERSIQQGQFVQANSPYGKTYPGSSRNNTDSNRNDENSSFADGDSCSSSDDSSGPITIEEAATAAMQLDDGHDQELKMWSDRLKEHKIRFDPNVLGPFDIAVVLTGSNDLKSAFFPFLLTGEDAEFRRQAQQRGGGYGNELTRILQVLNRRMRMRLQTLRESVEAAKERVLESVDNIRERLHSQDLNVPSGKGDSRSSTGARPQTYHRRAGRASQIGNVDAAKQLENVETNTDTASLLDGDEMLEGTTHTQTSLYNNPHFPMVVLPGMAARALPIFQTAPLRWLAVPIVDIMDSHKRKLARHHDGEVFFIEAPSWEAMADFFGKNGVYWQEVVDDHVLLNLRGIKRKHALTIESDMAAYFAKKVQTPKPGTLPFRRRHYSMFSVDGIHPNDQGYEFWGRYIARAIVEEWRRKQALLGNPCDFA
jgi:hypothetical protein